MAESTASIGSGATLDDDPPPILEPKRSRLRGRLFVVGVALALGASALLVAGRSLGIRMPWLRGAPAGGSTTPPSSPARAGLVDAALDSPKLTTEGAWGERATDRRARPNIVMITLESVGANHVGFLGYEREVTPNLDRIASESWVFERAYTTATHSNYAQMAILSSLFPRRGTTLDMYGRLDYPRFLMHDVAHQLGYLSATISSQDESWQGMLRFQTTATPTHVRHSPDYHGPHLNLVSEEIVPDEETARLAIEWIDTTEGAPFSLYVNFQSTHFPYPIPETAPRPFAPTDPKGTFNFLHWDPADRQAIVNRYDNALRYVDAQVGKVIDALDERDLLNHTIVVIAADHGEMFFDHDLVTHGRSLFEGETRVPLLIHAPDGDTRRVAEPVSTLDIVPTVIDLMGLASYPAHQGASVRWTGLPKSERHAAIFMNVQGWKHLEAVVCLPYKLVFDPEADSTEVYDLARDPGETRNVAGQELDASAALKTLLEAQIEAQQRYHAMTDEGAALRADRFAPNLLPCPIFAPSSVNGAPR